MADSQLKILEFLQTYNDPRTGQCTPSVKKIADGVKLSRGHVRRLLRQLVSEGFLEIEERWRATEDPYGDANSETIERDSNLYRFVTPKGNQQPRLRRSGIMSTFTGAILAQWARFWYPEMLSA